MTDFDPYAPPAHAGSGEAIRRLVGPRTALGWIAVFLLNMIVPLLFGWSMTREGGRVGMAAAILTLFATGCWICTARRQLASPLLLGAAFVGLSQVFPLLQILAGSAGMVAATALRVAENNDDALPRVIGEAGGFVVTLVTGGLLMAASLVAGLSLRMLTPAHWWPREAA
ncbi:hypothetical protein OJF2_38750 [Aquisphaera giovannonii]|uniref:Uncharacterized protein n=1 Tax=Aquisphaera giovannonii TaxID=406548 RepID=A0A5B9W571_9BACT|nr:hypothetical protein [Aquisphaera giovannonii]QEH35324.1 hypothetical protein OJF2_38750 [Aquisphaera giovannonii]